ncbi:hypothetical protein IWW47_003043, partial [Coemansia sp. RSA 2052]
AKDMDRDSAEQRIPPPSHTTHEPLTYDKSEELAPQSLRAYQTSSRVDNAAADAWTAQRPDSLRTQQSLFYLPAITSPTQYYFAPHAGAQAPGPPMYHVQGAALPYTHNPVAFRPAELAGGNAAAASASAVGYQQMRRIRCTQACNYCHRRKARCVRNVFADGSVRCDSCLRDNIVCEWRKSRRRGPKRREGDELPSTRQDVGAEARGSTESGNDESIQLGSDSRARARAKSTLSIASLLNVTDDFLLDNDDSEYASASAETIAAPASGGNIQQLDLAVSLDANSAGSHYPLPACSRPATLQPPPLGNLVEEFFSTKVNAELREAVIAYYTFFYGCCPILHPSTLLRKVVSGTLCPLLEDSLRASTSVFVSKRLGCSIDTDALFSRLVATIAIRAEAPTVDEVCAFQLASIGVSGLRGFVCFDTLKTAVSGLLVQLEWHELDRYDPPRQRLGLPLSWDEWVERETKRRVLWINFKIDSHHAGVAGRPPVIDEGSVFLRAPCSDAEWDDLSLALLLQGTNTRGAATASVGRAGAQAKLAVAVLEAFSQSFKVFTPYESFMARVGMMQRSAKASWIQQRSLALNTKDMAGPRLLGESPLFQKYDAELRAWKNGLIRAEALRDPLLSPHGASFFGDIRQRTFLVRVRYFCINIYALGMGTILHLANRPSFFTEAEYKGMPMDPPLASDLEKEAPAINTLLVYLRKT